MDVKNKTFNSFMRYYEREKDLAKFVAVCHETVKSPKSTPLIRGEVCECVLYVMLQEYIRRNNLTDWRISKGLILKDLKASKDSGYLAELDITLFTPKCIFAFECKSYRGEKYLKDKGTLVVKTGGRFKEKLDVFQQHYNHFTTLNSNLKGGYIANDNPKYKSYKLLYFDFSDQPIKDKREEKYRRMFPICNVNNLHSLFMDYNKRPDYWNMNYVNKVVDIIEKVQEKNTKLHLDYVTNLHGNKGKK